MARLRRKKISDAPKRKKPENQDGKIATEPEVAVGSTQTVRATKKIQAPVAKKGKKSFFSNRYLQQAIQFLREVKIELKKVTWPSRKQTMGSTAVVIVLVIIIAFFLGAIDIGLSSLIRLVLP